MSNRVPKLSTLLAATLFAIGSAVASPPAVASIVLHNEGSVTAQAGFTIDYKNGGPGASLSKFVGVTQPHQASAPVSTGVSLSKGDIKTIQVNWNILPGENDSSAFPSTFSETYPWGNTYSSNRGRKYRLEWSDATIHFYLY